MVRRSVSMLLAPRKRIVVLVLLMLFIVSVIINVTITGARMEQENKMEESIVSLQTHLEFLKAQYRGRQEDVLTLQNFIDFKCHVRTDVFTKLMYQSAHCSLTKAKIMSERPVNGSSQFSNHEVTTLSPNVLSLLKNLSGTHAATGIYTKNIQQLQTPFVYQLLPHLMNDPNSLKPAFHMRGVRHFSDIVIGIPTVKRDKESYLMITLTHLISGMSEANTNTTSIVIMVGETDLQFVINTARQIEIAFPKHVDQGLIEVISPAPTYYPDFESLPDTLGDSHKRVKWRTKQNLDTIFLMAYAQSMGTFYLMLEDDVIAKDNYIQEIKQFTAATSVVNPDWFFIDFCHVGGIGKLFRSADLISFVTYVQIFYSNLPIDWLLESYLADKVCTIDKTSKTCGEQKLKIRPKFKSSLFQHIGLYSSLKGKIHKVKDTKLWTAPTFYPHSNPPLNIAKTTIKEYQEHTLKGAYEGHTFFWGIKPKAGDVVEFWFQQPTAIDKYIFRSGNVDHPLDKFTLDTAVEVLPKDRSLTGNFTKIGSFDEFGLAEGDLHMGPIWAIRLKVNRNSKYWVILSEIDLKMASHRSNSS